MRIAILDPAAGISGDMTLGALLSAGAPAAWLEELPRRLDLRDVRVTVREVTRSGVACTQVEFAIPEQPHGRHVGELVRLVERAPLSDWVKQRAVRAFRLIGEAEGRVHGVAPERVHLHEVGAVDALLDIVGGIEGFAQLGVEAVYNLPVAVGSGWVEAAHGRLPVPAPATAILLEGVEVAGDPGPVEGEATTPTGAALVRVLSSGAPPARWRMVRSGWGAGQRNPPQYPNALRILVAELRVGDGESVTRRHGPGELACLPIALGELHEEHCRQGEARGIPPGALGELPHASGLALEAGERKAADGFQVGRAPRGGRHYVDEVRRRRRDRQEARASAADQDRRSWTLKRPRRRDRSA